MVDIDGYISLTDFGLSKKMSGRARTNSFCGTPNHFSPEIVNRNYYSFEVDIWSFGVLLYELLVGRCPFSGKSIKDLFDKISNCECGNDIIEYPICVSETAKDLISNILTKKEKRFNIQQIKSHPFYKDINWDNILNKKEKAPFKPKLRNNEDTKYFYIFENEKKEIKKSDIFLDSTFTLEESLSTTECFSYESIIDNIHL